VKAGDVVKYGDFLALWGSQNRSITVPLDLLDVNSTLWVTNTVLNVSGDVVTFEAETSYRNGSVTSEIAKVDVATGVGSGNLSLVSANLAAADRVYTMGDMYATRINASSLRSYVGLMRETNLLNLTNVTFDLESTKALWNKFFWDKATGVMVEQLWSYAFVDIEGQLTEASVEYKMVDNNIWVGEHVQDLVPPVAVAGADLTVEVGANVTFDGGGSRDDVGITQLEWDFGDGSSGSGLQVFHVFSTAGVYNVTLTVEDGGSNSASDVLVVTVEQSPDSSSPLSGFVPFGIVVLLVVIVLVWFLLKRR